MTTQLFAFTTEAGAMNDLSTWCHQSPEEAASLIRSLRGALAWIHNSTEPDAVRHRSYEELAEGIYKICKVALDGDFVDDMHAAEIYDELRRRELIQGSAS